MSHIPRPSFAHFDEETARLMDLLTVVPADALVRQSGVLDSTLPISLLDNAGGAGPVTSQLFKNLREEQKAQATVIVGDNEWQMLALAEDRSRKEGWVGTSCELIDAQDMLTISDSSLTHVLTNFGPQLFQNAEQAMKEIHRVLEPGGVNGFTSWRQLGWMPAYRRVAPTIPPSFSLFESCWVQEAQITADLTRLGFKDVTYRTLEFTTDVGDPDKYTSNVQKIVPNIWTPEIAEKVTRCLLEEFGGKPVWKAVIVTAIKA